MKIIWKMIEFLTCRKRKNYPTISKILYNNKCYTSKLSICNQLNTYFVIVGPNLSANYQTLLTLILQDTLLEIFQTALCLGIFTRMKCVT